MGKDREGSVASTSTDLKDCDGTCVGLCDLRQDGKFLLEPFSVFEEICGIVLIEIIPPFCGIGIESGFEIVSADP